MHACARVDICRSEKHVSPVLSPKLKSSSTVRPNESSVSGIDFRPADTGVGAGKDGGADADTGAGVGLPTPGLIEGYTHDGVFVRGMQLMLSIVIACITNHDDITFDMIRMGIFRRRRSRIQSGGRPRSASRG